MSVKYQGHSTPLCKIPYFFPLYTYNVCCATDGQWSWRKFVTQRLMSKQSPLKNFLSIICFMQLIFLQFLKIKVRNKASFKHIFTIDFLLFYVIPKHYAEQNTKYLINISISYLMSRNSIFFSHCYLWRIFFSVATYT